MKSERLRASNCSPSTANTESWGEEGKIVEMKTQKRDLRTEELQHSRGNRRKGGILIGGGESFSSNASYCTRNLKEVRRKIGGGSLLPGLG